MSQQQPSDEELRAALEEQMRRITVEDVLLQTAVTLVNLAGRRLGLGPPGEETGPKDVEQARLAIEGVRALLPLCPADQVKPIRDAVSQLQVAYAREARSPEPAGGPAGSEEGARAGEHPGGAEEAAKEAGDGEDAAERAKARSKVWTPPGS